MRWFHSYCGVEHLVLHCFPTRRSSDLVAEKLNFGNFENIEISGYKWVDTDGDKTWGATEPGKQGWVIYLDDNNNFADAVLASTTTHANAKYSFTDLGPGHYFVYEKTETGWTNTFNGATDFVAQSGLHHDRPFPYTTIFRSGNFENIEISGYKWVDTDGDKTWGATEPGKQGWVIYLDDNNNFADGVLARSEERRVGKDSCTDLGPGHYFDYEKTETDWANAFNGA